MKRPTYDQLLLAAEWLDCGEGVDMEDCKAVAAWLRETAEDAELRRAAREGGVPVARLRRKLAEQKSSLNSVSR